LRANDVVLYTATALFVDRARAVDHRFALTDENAPTVAEICRRLDGIPLAIELAAARAKILSPRQLRERLDERFHVLTGGSRDVLPRQQTLRALIDWSHDLLDERGRTTLFRRLGIFVNGFTLEGALAVGSGDGLDELDVFDVLASLVDKSLVLAEPDADALLHRLLESTRAYAAEKLTEAGERDVIADRHLRYLRDTFTQLYAEHERTLRTAGLNATFATELDDLRVALEGALTRADVIAGAELLAALDGAWVAFALHREGSARTESFAAQLPVTETLLRAKLLTIHAARLFNAGMDVSAGDVAVKAVAAARESGDSPTLALGLLQLAYVSIYLDDIAAAKSAIDEADAISGTSALQKWRLVGARALVYLRIGDLDAALPIFVEARQQSRALGDDRTEALNKMYIAAIEHQRGHTLAAIDIMREIIPASRHLTDTPLLARASANLSGFLVAVDDLPAAVEAARESITMLAYREPDHLYVINAIEHLALVCALCDDFARAAVLAAYSDAALARIGATRDLTEQTTHVRLAAILREKLAPRDLARLTAEGVAFTPEAAIAIAQGVTAP
jgi:hypothetical protein